jgi:hypothetical protein
MARSFFAAFLEFAQRGLGKPQKFLRVAFERAGGQRPEGIRECAFRFVEQRSFSSKTLSLRFHGRASDPSPSSSPESSAAAE